MNWVPMKASSCHALVGVADHPAERTEMGIGDLADKAKDLASEHEDAVTDGIDKAADLADEKTEGKYSDQIETGADKAKDFVEEL